MCGCGEGEVVPCSMVSRYPVSGAIYVDVGWGCWATIGTGAIGAGDAGSAHADAP